MPKDYVTATLAVVKAQAKLDALSELDRRTQNEPSSWLTYAIRDANGELEWTDIDGEHYELFDASDDIVKVFASPPVSPELVARALRKIADHIASEIAEPNTVCECEPGFKCLACIHRKREETWQAISDWIDPEGKWREFVGEEAILDALQQEIERRRKALASQETEDPF